MSVKVNATINGTTINDTIEVDINSDVGAVIATFANKNKIRCLMYLSYNGQTLDEETILKDAGITGNGETVVISTDARAR